jgi:hypothetical protein
MPAMKMTIERHGIKRLIKGEKAMRPTRGWGYVVAITLAAASLTVSASAAWADFTVQFPAGQACSFALDVSGTGGNGATRHETNGVTISAGTGSALTFSGNGKTVSFTSNGAASVVRKNLDKSFTEQLTGHNVVILFPTDNPAGPSTTLIVGRVVIDVSPTNDFNVVSISGTQTDICALLR